MEWKGQGKGLRTTRACVSGDKKVSTLKKKHLETNMLFLCILIIIRNPDNEIHDRACHTKVLEINVEAAHIKVLC
jgi:hypothetical protein